MKRQEVQVADPSGTKSEAELSQTYPMSREDAILVVRHWLKERTRAEMERFFERRDDDETSARDRELGRRAAPHLVQPVLRSFPA